MLAPLRVLSATACVTAFAVGLFAQGQATLVKDINTVVPYNQGSLPGNFVQLGGTTLFTAYAPNLGLSLWRTDGTAAGTQVVRDLDGATAAYAFVVAGGSVFFFTAPDNIRLTIWRTDGSTVGTRSLRTLQGSVTYDPSGLAVIGNRVVFAGGDPASGTEPWVTDGTSAGTVLLKDIVPGSIGSQPLGLAAAGGRVFFSADDGVHGRELWSTDGTAAGTALVRDVAPGMASGIDSNLPALTADATGVWLAANDGATGSELWRSDGTSAGTVRVADLQPGAGSSSPQAMLWTGQHLWFAASTTAAGEELWRSDGTTAGTVMIRDLDPGAGSSSPRNLVWTGTRLFFTASEPNSGREPWQSDGTTAGTTQLLDIYPGWQGSNPRFLSWSGATLCFAATTPGAGAELWRSDGTAAGTVQVVDLNPGSPSGVGEALAWVGGAVLFEGSDANTVRELFRSDGTAAGTSLVADLYTEPGSSWPTSLVDQLGTLLFVAGDAVAGAELWRSDGTAGGTTLVRDIAVGPASSSIFALFPFANTVVFGANDGILGVEPWRSDGTAAGTRNIANLNSQGFGSDPGGWTRFRDGVWFQGYSYPSYRVWQTTLSGGVQTMNMGPNVVQVGAMLAIGDTLFYAGNQYEPLYGGTGMELWKTNGTTPVLVRDIAPGPSGSAPAEFVELDGRLVFSATDANGAGLWISDGTAAGTVPLRYFFATYSPRPASLTRAGRLVYFVASDNATGVELWRTDGTTAGTFLVRDVLPGPDTSVPYGLTAFDDVLYFTADDGQVGRELWRSDGTAQGTWLLKDVQPGPGSGLPVNYFGNRGPILLALAGARQFLFAADNGQNGTELWRSDGTTAGTVLHQDLAPGRLHSHPRDLTAVGNRLFFTAEDLAHGTKLWAMDAMAHAAPFGLGCPGTGGRTPVIAPVGTPLMGNAAFAVALRGARPNALVVLALGGGLAEIPVGNGCWIDFQRLLLTVFLTSDGSGQGSVALPVPNDASLRGAVAAAQFAVSDPSGAFQQSLALTSGLRIVISDR